MRYSEAKAVIRSLHANKWGKIPGYSVYEKRIKRGAFTASAVMNFEEVVRAHNIPGIFERYDKRMDNELNEHEARRMKASERHLYLESKHQYNFRHGQENPVIIGTVMFFPEGGVAPRPCFKVKYHSDGKVDYIPTSEVEYGTWRYANNEKPAKRHG